MEIRGLRIDSREESVCHGSELDSSRVTESIRSELWLWTLDLISIRSERCAEECKDQFFAFSSPRQE